MRETYLRQKWASSEGICTKTSPRNRFELIDMFGSYCLEAAKIETDVMTQMDGNFGCSKKFFRSLLIPGKQNWKNLQLPSKTPTWFWQSKNGKALQSILHACTHHKPVSAICYSQDYFQSKSGSTQKKRISSILVIPRMLMIIMTMMLIHRKLNFNLYTRQDVRCRNAHKEIYFLLN